MKTITNLILVGLLSFHSLLSFAVRDTTLASKIDTTLESLQDKTDSFIEFENYLDVNYSHDFNNPINQIRLYGSNPMNVNQFSLAYAYSQLKFENKHIKVVTAVATGGIVKLMYLAEPNELKWIREISLFYKFKKEGWGIEAGIMPSVYGVETFINRDNQHATRAIMTDFAPDFEQGARFHYKFGKNWYGKLQVTNGWQVLKDNNCSPGFGWINMYGDPEKSFINLGLYAGEEPYQGRTNQLKLFGNLFAKINLGDFSIWPMIDYGFQKDSLGKFQPWYAYGASVRYQLPKKFAVAMRYEHVNDPHAIIGELLNPTNQWIHDGYTATLEYVPFDGIIVRLEGISANAKTAVFTTSDGGLIKSDNLIMLAVHYTLPAAQFQIHKKENLHK